MLIQASLLLVRAHADAEVAGGGLADRVLRVRREAVLEGVSHVSAVLHVVPRDGGHDNGVVPVEGGGPLPPRGVDDDGLLLVDGAGGLSGGFDNSGHVVDIVVFWCQLKGPCKFCVFRLQRCFVLDL